MAPWAVRFAGYNLFRVVSYVCSLKAQAVYIRRGSSTDIAGPEEIAAMGRSCLYKQAS